MRPEHPNSISSERNAVHLKSGQPVSPSGPGLKEPTLPPTADRTSAAHLITRQSALRSGGNPLQHKRGQGLRQSPMSAEGALPFPPLDPSETAKLVEFFLLLDTWDRRRDDSPLLLPVRRMPQHFPSALSSPRSPSLRANRSAVPPLSTAPRVYSAWLSF